MTPELLEEKEDKIRYLEEVNMTLKQTNDDLNEEVADLKRQLQEAMTKVACRSRLITSIISLAALGNYFPVNTVGGHLLRGQAHYDTCTDVQVSSLESHLCWYFSLAPLICV